jgi:hypothetical protein
MSLAPGARLGPYEILAAIGAGGMGEVYRARDTRLGRDVAIKVIAPAFSADAERVQRFDQEARAAATLNHPNILAVYDIGTHDGAPFIVSELLEGETLRGRMNAGPLSVRKAVDFGIQIAQGLAAAHEKGIVHRDLKPENIFITKDSRAKILDFGLAKLTQSDSTLVAASNLPTSPLPNQTRAGMVLGTIGYMAPEQVRAQAVDHRADIFALGAILFEMLSGRRAFMAETGADTMLAVLKDDPPDLARSRADVPPPLDHIVRHCLEKGTTDRFQSARDVAFALGAMSIGVSSSSAGTAARASKHVSMPLLASVLLGALLLVIGAFVAGARSVVSSEDVPGHWQGHVLGGPTVAFGPRISPNGQTLAFQTLVDRLSQVAVMNPQSGDWALLTKDRTRGLVQHVSWSPDGSTIYFDRFFESPVGIFSVPSVGGEPRLVLEDAMWPEPLPDGSLVVTKINKARVRQLYRFFPETQRLEELNALPTNAYSTSWPPLRVFPKGREVVFLGQPLGSDSVDRLHVLDLQSHHIRELVPGLILPFQEVPFVTFPLAVTPDGRSVLFNHPAGDVDRIVSAPADGSGTVTPVMTLGGSPYYIDVSRDGVMYVDDAERPSEILRYSPTEARLDRYPLSLAYQTRQHAPSLPLPDGRVVVPMPGAGGNRLVVAELGRDPVRFIQRQEETYAPMALLGRNTIAFMLGSGEKRTVAVASISDGRVMRRIDSLAGKTIAALAASPDGKTLFYVLAGEIWSMALDGGEAKKFRAGDSLAIDPSGTSAFVRLNDPDGARLIRVPLDGGDEQAVPLQPEFRHAPAPISPSAVAKDGRIAIRVMSRDSWFWPAAILDPRSGKVALLPGAPDADMRLPSWTEDGRLITTAMGMRSKLWKFQRVAARAAK